MADQLGFLPERVFTAAAMPGAGYRVEFFQSGTTTPVAVYTTAALSVAHPSPLVCDANGVFPAVFSAGGAIKAVITKPDGSSFYTLDPVFRVSTSGSGAAQVTFDPTPGLPFNNVQDAIEGAAASAASGFTPFGLGVTGTNALIADINATGTASGSYRFDNTTTGTFPTGVTAANTGTVQINRENSGDAVMFLQSGTADRTFFRRLATSTWGAWQEIITVPQGAAEGDSIYRGASAWLRLAKGTAGQLLRMDAAAVAPEWFGGSVGPTATTSGTNVDITGLPASAKQVTLMLNSISTDATANILIRPRAGGTIVGSGYQTALSAINSGGAVGEFDTTQIRTRSQPAANFLTGTLIFSRTPGGNFWNFTGSAQSASGLGTEYLGWGGGVALGSALEGFAISTTAGAFDNGSVALYWS